MADKKPEKPTPDVTSKMPRKPNPPGRPSNIPDNRNTPGVQKGHGGSMGGPTSRSGR